MNFIRNIFAQLQPHMLRLTEEDRTPLLLLETMFQEEFSLLPGVLLRISMGLDIFGMVYFTSPLVIGYSTNIENKFGLTNITLCAC